MGVELTGLEEGFNEEIEPLSEWTAEDNKQVGFS